MNNNSTKYAKSLKYLKDNITINTITNYDNNILNYINSDGSVDLLDLNNDANYNNFVNNITEENIMKSFILNTTYYDDKIDSSTNNKYYELFNNIKPWAIYFAKDYDSTTHTLYDSSGNERHASTFGNITAGKSSGNGASNMIDYIQGGVDSGVNFPNGSIPKNFTIASVTRYTGDNKKRILQARNLDWYHGNDNNTVNTCKYGIQKTIEQPTSSNNTNWIRIIGKNSNNLNSVIANGSPIAITNDNGGFGSNALTINRSIITTDKNSDWALSCVIIWDFTITDNEMTVVDEFLGKYMNDTSNPIPKEKILVKNTDLIKPCLALNQAEIKYNFLLQILIQLYNAILPYKNDLSKPNIINLLQNQLKFITNINAYIVDEELVLEYRNDFITILMKDMYNINSDTTNFVKSISDDQYDIPSYDKLFAIIKPELLKHIDFIKNYNMFQCKSYVSYYLLSYTIFKYTAKIFRNINKIISKPFNFLPINEGSINNINNTEFAYIKFDKTNTLYPINFLEDVMCDILIVGGGGGGGIDNIYGGGGGGGGNVLYNKNFKMNKGIYKIIVGNGGDPGNNGKNSFIKGDNFILSSSGGGAGGGKGNGSSNGDGGGGGGGCDLSNTYTNGGSSSKSGSGGKGYSNASTNSYTAGGGGGAANGGISGSHEINIGGGGGNGITCDITSTNRYYGGGGGGASYIYNFTSSGGQGGGGNGGSVDKYCMDGARNTGGGGGGGSIISLNGGLGGSGIVIIKINRYDLQNINITNSTINLLDTVTYFINNADMIDIFASTDTMNNMYEIKKTDKEIQSSRMNIKRKNDKMKDYSKIIKTNYVEFIAIIILTLSVIFGIYLQIGNNTFLNINILLLLLFVLVIIYIFIYYYLFYFNIIDENFEIKYDPNIIDLFSNIFEQINIMINDTKISIIHHVNKPLMETEKDKFNNILNNFKFYNKNSLQEVKLSYLENITNKYKIMLFLNLSLFIIIASILLYYYNNYYTIIALTIILFLIAYYYLYKTTRYVKTNNDTYYWKKPNYNK